MAEVGYRKDRGLGIKLTSDSVEKGRTEYAYRLHSRVSLLKPAARVSVVRTVRTRELSFAHLRCKTACERRDRPFGCRIIQQVRRSLYDKRPVSQALARSVESFLTLYATTDEVLMIAAPRFMCGTASRVSCIIWMILVWNVLKIFSS
jgi:hypothetical protein